MKMSSGNITERVVLFHLELKCKEIGLRKFCREHHLDPEHVSKIINGKKPMSETVAESLGYNEDD